MVQWWNARALCALPRVIASGRLRTPTFAVSALDGVDWRSMRDVQCVKVVVFDKDNTLALPYSSGIDVRAARSFNDCVAVFGVDNISVVSNSLGSSDHTPDDEESLLAKFAVRHGSKKPSGEVFDAILRKHDGVDPLQILIVGDRLLTDVVFANLHCAKSMLVDPLDVTKDPWIVRVLARPFEAMLRASAA